MDAFSAPELCWYPILQQVLVAELYSEPPCACCCQQGGDSLEDNTEMTPQEQEIHQKKIAGIAESFSRAWRSAAKASRQDDDALSCEQQDDGDCLWRSAFLDALIERQGKGVDLAIHLTPRTSDNEAWNMYMRPFITHSIHLPDDMIHLVAGRLNLDVAADPSSREATRCKTIMRMQKEVRFCGTPFACAGIMHRMRVLDGWMEAGWFGSA